MPTNSPKAYSFAADVVRVVAILGVVSIHVVSAVYDRLDFWGGATWWVSAFWNALARPAIPLFVMLSGFLLLPKKESLSALSRRIFNRLLIPFLSFFIIFRWWSGGHPSWGYLQPQLMLTALLHAKVAILYFLLIMIALYALLPLFRKFFVPLSVKNQWRVSLALLFAGIAISLTEYMFQSFFLNNAFLLWVPYTGFFLMGHVLGQLRLNRSSQRIMLAIYLASVIATVLLSNHYSQQASLGNLLQFPPEAISAYFDFHLSPNVVLMSASLFILLFQFQYSFLKKLPVIEKMVKSLARASFGIYLIHLLVIQVLETYFRFSVDYTSLPLLPFLLIKFVVVLSITYVLFEMVKRIPLLSRAVGSRT